MARMPLQYFPYQLGELMNSMQLYGMIRVASQPMHAELANQVPFDTLVADIMGSILACLTAETLPTFTPYV